MSEPREEHYGPDAVKRLRAALKEALKPPRTAARIALATELKDDLRRAEAVAGSDLSTVVCPERMFALNPPMRTEVRNEGDGVVVGARDLSATEMIMALRESQKKLPNQDQILELADADGADGGPCNFSLGAYNRAIEKLEDAVKRGDISAAIARTWEVAAQLADLHGAARAAFAAHAARRDAELSRSAAHAVGARNGRGSQYVSPDHDRIVEHFGSLREKV